MLCMYSELTVKAAKCQELCPIHKKVVFHEGFFKQMGKNPQETEEIRNRVLHIFKK